MADHPTPLEDLLRRAQHAVDHADDHAAQARETRRKAIEHAIAAGMTEYRVAKILGLTQTAVRMIRKHDRGTKGEGARDGTSQ